MAGVLLPEWESMGTARRCVEAVVLPAVGGLTTGWQAGRSTPLYAVGVLLAALGAVWIGAQHRSARDAVWRGVLSGLIYASGVLIGLEQVGGNSPAPTWLVPDFSVLLFLMLAVPSVPLHRVGSVLRTRRS